MSAFNHECIVELKTLIKPRLSVRPVWNPEDVNLKSLEGFCLVLCFLTLFQNLHQY